MTHLRLTPKLSGDAERATKTTLDTIEITGRLVGSWKSPPFQRTLTINQKVKHLIEEVRRDGVIPGVLTLGILDDVVYVVDGQHRLNACLQADLPVAYADVRWHYFDSMAAMAAEYVRINTPLVRLRPDDVLKGLEQSNVYLKRIRSKCPYIGYDVVRRTQHSPVLSMSTFLRVWFGTRAESPVLWGSALMVAEQLDDQETDAAIEFIQTCFEAWHRDVEYSKLYGSLNLILCGWLWRNVVKATQPKQKKGISRCDKMTIDQFKRGMMSLSAASDYLEWLVGRRISDHDRAPAYGRMKSILVNRYLQDQKSKLRLPQPAWTRGAS